MPFFIFFLKTRSSASKEMESLPLHICHVQTLSIFVNRSHALIHSIALACLIYYRASFLFEDKDPKTKDTPLILPWLLVFASELLLSFIWLLGQAYRWRPVTRTVFPERLTDDDKLPPIDVFICTTDPIKEPTIGVMNTVLSAMALDYPPEKLHVYLSDDGRSPITLHGMKEACWFARWWLPFCRRYRIKTRSPEAYFSTSKDGDEGSGSSEFITERQKIKVSFLCMYVRVWSKRSLFVLKWIHFIIHIKSYKSKCIQRVFCHLKIKILNLKEIFSISNEIVFVKSFDFAYPKTNFVCASFSFLLDFN